MSKAFSILEPDRMGAAGHATRSGRDTMPSRTSVPGTRTPEPKFRTGQLLRLNPRQELAGHPAARARGVADVAPGQAVRRRVRADDLENGALGHRLQALTLFAGPGPQVDASAPR